MKNIILIYSILAFISTITFAQTVQHSCGPDSVHNPNLTYGIVNDIDGNAYKTIAIGSQVWMAENLKTSRYLNGDNIPLIESSNDWINTFNTQKPASCWYNNDSTIYSCPYGKLYNWIATKDARNICPLNWHVPSDSEWIQLVDFIDPFGGGVNGGTIVGKKLKSTSTQFWLNNSSLVSDNFSGFSALASGYRENNGSYNNLGIGGLYWSSTEGGLFNTAYFYAFRNDASAIVISYGTKQDGYCVRCIKDSLVSTPIDYLDNSDTVSVYPNPATSEINISISSTINFTTQIVNTLGETVLQSQNENKIDVSELNKGIYFIRISQGGKIFNSKIIKQ